MTLACLVSIALIAQPQQPVVGPASGSLLVVGGGELTRPIVNRFVTLAGGADSPVIYIPTAEQDPIDIPAAVASFKRAFGFTNVTVIHTRDRNEANSEQFVAPIKKARAVWFDGGRQWRLVDSFAGTLTQREIEGVLARGGVIGGSSAGATIQGSYLVRGAREGNQVMMAKGYEEGFGYLKGVAVDQHLITRRRADDLVEVIEAHPELLGIGIDEATAIVVKGDEFEVIGRGVVGIYDNKDHDGKKYYFVAPGEHFNLKTRRRIAN
jgi:cyanophycinase